MIFFRVSPVKLHCGTDDSKFLLFFLHSLEMVKLLRGKNTESSRSWSHSVIYQMVDAVLQTLSQSRPLLLSLILLVAMNIERLII